MEILSVGEKIKRARIYEGLTLKDVCNDKISLSKLSCIENGKMEPNDELLCYLAGRLELDYNYLKKNEEQQLHDNFNLLVHNDDNSDYEKNMKYCFTYAKDNKLYDIEFEILHNIFNYYIKNNRLDSIGNIIIEYYYLNKYLDKDNKCFYCMDMAYYYYISSELFQAVNYYKLVIKQKMKEKIEDQSLIDALYYECKIYVKLGKYNEALNSSYKLLNLIDKVENKHKKSNMYKIIAGIFLRVNNEKFEKYEELSLKFIDADNDKAITLLYYSNIMFDIGFYNKGMQYLTNSIQMYKNDNKIKYTRFLISAVQVVIKSIAIEKFHSLFNKVVDYAIESENIKMIEKAYHLKTKMMIKEKNYDKAEIYLNLSLHFSKELGNQQELYKKYIELGYIAYKLKNVKDSINYYNLAIGLSKNNLKEYTLN